MHYFLLIYLNNQPLHVSSRLAAHHQEDQLCLNSNWYSLATVQQPVNITQDYTNCCLDRVDTPDDEQQACSKHVEAYYWNKLIENSASYWFILYGYIMMHGQKNIISVVNWYDLIKTEVSVEINWNLSSIKLTEKQSKDDWRIPAMNERKINE